jgi:hypothetical protein
MPVTFGADTPTITDAPVKRGQRDELLRGISARLPPPISRKWQVTGVRSVDGIDADMTKYGQMTE